ncbi:hypothetical protein P9139_07450 [Curtobacterium flaccumfaciens]|nr:hypothetical protein P9139_07450 [Curtobacterium flaccumfaciens]
MDTRRGARNLGRALPRTTLVWVAVAVVALVVVDVVLVTLALGRTDPQQHGSAGPIPTFTSTPDVTETPSPTGSPSAAPTASGDPASATAPGRRLLSAVSGLEAWRASSGTCGGERPVLEHTADGGATWVPTDLGTDVGSVMAIRASSTGLSIMVGTGPDCAASAHTTTDGGATWSPADDGVAGAGIDADGVVLASSTIEPPCADPIDAFQGDRTTVVICDGQLEWRTGSEPWIDVPLGGVRSLAVDGDHYVLARVGVAQCAGVQIETMTAIGVTAATQTDVVGCADHLDDITDVAIARAGTTCGCGPGRRQGVVGRWCDVVTRRRA